MKVCPICKAACFEDMETCYGCMYRFDTERREDTLLKAEVLNEEGAQSAPKELKGPQGEALPQIRSTDAVCRRPAPRHAAEAMPHEPGQHELNMQTRQPKTGRSLPEGFQAEYQLVISLKPFTSDSSLQNIELSLSDLT